MWTSPLPPECKLPKDDPRFLYPGTQNPYLGKIKKTAPFALADASTENCDGHWRSAFVEPLPKDAPLHVEIGCNAGHVWVPRAAAHPDQGFIGIDAKYKVIHRAAEKAQKRGLKNALFLRAFAQRLDYIFGPEEVDSLSLYFPDPWPKKAHLKNRFFTSERLARLAKIVKPGGVFEIRTDHDGYFEQMLEEIARCEKEAPRTWKATESTWDYYQGHPDPTQLQIPDVTLFERLFIRDGIKIKRVVLKRTP